MDNIRTKTIDGRIGGHIRVVGAHGVVHLQQFKFLDLDSKCQKSTFRNKNSNLFIFALIYHICSSFPWVVIGFRSYSSYRSVSVLITIKITMVVRLLLSFGDFAN